MCFSSIKAPLLVCWASHQYLKKWNLQYWRMQNGCKISLMSPQQSSAMWEAQKHLGRGEMWGCFAVLGPVVPPKRGEQVLWSWNPFRPHSHWGASEIHAAGMLLTWPAAHVKQQCVLVNVCERQTDRQTGRGAMGWAMPAGPTQHREKPYHPQVQYNARIQESNLQFLISLPRLFQPACLVYSRIKW